MIFLSFLFTHVITISQQTSKTKGKTIFEISIISFDCEVQQKKRKIDNPDILDGIITKKKKEMSFYLAQNQKKAKMISMLSKDQKVIVLLSVDQPFSSVIDIPV